MGEKADLVLYNANVITLDAARPRAGLVAVRGGRIGRVGDNDERSDIEGRQIDCQGKTLIPGFNDAHCHVLALAAGFSRVDCSPFSSPPVSSIPDIKARIGERAQQLPEGEWIKASGYNEFYLAGKRHPNRHDLDEAAPNHPVRLVHRSQHACVLNGLALSRVGISGDTPEPPGGMIDRDLDTGEPNGILYEMNDYVDRMVPPLPPGEIEEGIRLASDEYLSNGITSVQDATASNGLPEWGTLQGLKQRGCLVPRLSAMMGIDSLEALIDNGLVPRYGDDGMRMGALKIVLSEARGSLYPGQEGLDERVSAAHRAGYQLAIHAVEEGTVEAAIAALERIPAGHHRHRIEHCAVCPSHLVERLRDVRAVVVTNPAFVYYNGERYMATVPPGQREWLYRTGSLLGYGIATAAGSDSPVVPLNPLMGIYAAVTREAASGETLLPDERISPLAALEMYTRAAAYASFDEGVKGTVSAGKPADLALLSADPTQVSHEEIRDIAVEMTIVDGQIVWQA